ncbi:MULTISPECIES: DUF3164 family protein [unclassified Xanthobacter]|uniref:DUF3164 family protein n=1 Tax=unclassified Xanthobacter TaxID=2623496 RepID=UPI001EDD665E|nr:MULTISPECIES: DUF3164 family protein [unclassified Xanthobacter]
MDTQSDCMRPAAAIEIASPIIVVHGEEYMRDSSHALVPVGKVDVIDKLMDEEVRKIIAYARDLSAQVARFKKHCVEDVSSFQALVDQEYGAKIGGKKGNVTLTSFDGTLKVTLKMADLLEFGPELQSAKKLVDECLTEWAAGSSENLRAIVQRAFQVDKEGKVNRAELFMLLRVAIEDERWQRAMDAIRDSIRVVGSKAYFHFQERATADDEWSTISIHMAKA